MSDKLHSNPFPLGQSYNMKIPYMYRYPTPRFLSMLKRIWKFTDISALNTLKKKRHIYTSSVNLRQEYSSIRNLIYRLLLFVELNKLWTLINPHGIEITAGPKLGSVIVPSFHRKNPEEFIPGTAGIVYKPYDRSMN